MKKALLPLLGILMAIAVAGTNLNFAYAAEKPIELRWVSLMTLATLDPAQVRGNPMFAVATNLYDTLVFPDPEKGYIPWLCKSWKVSDDGLKYTFYLKEDIRFHDGTELTANDVVFSMDRMLKLKESTISHYFEFIDPGTTKAIDPYTVEFNLKRKAPQFMVTLFIFRILNEKMIMNNKAEGNYGEFGDYGVKFLLTNDAGSGPYTVVEHRVGDYFKMKRFEKYPFVNWRANSIDFVSIATIPEAVTEVTKIKAGELDMGEWTLPGESLRELQKDSNLYVSEEFTDGIWYAPMNNMRPPLDDPFVRKASAHAWDTETVMKIVGGGKIIRGPLPLQMQGGCTDIVGYDFDLEKAKALLKKSKYSADELKKFELEMPNGISDRYNRIFLSFYSNLKKIGLNPKLITLTWPDMGSRQTKPETALHYALITHVARVPDPTQFLDFYTKAGWGKATPPGGMYYSNPKVTEAIETASNFSTREEQNKYYCIAQRLIAEDSPAIFSHNDFRLFPMWRYVKGYKYPAGCEYYQFRFDRMTMDTDDPMFRKNHGW